MVRHSYFSFPFFMYSSFSEFTEVSIYLLFFVVKEKNTYYFSFMLSKIHEEKKYMYMEAQENCYCDCSIFSSLYLSLAGLHLSGYCFLNSSSLTLDIFCIFDNYQTFSGRC